MKLSDYRWRLRCRVRQVSEVIDGCMAEALRVMTPAGAEAFVDAASDICNLGRGDELPVIFLEAMPRVVASLDDEAILAETVEAARMLSRASHLAIHAAAINPFLATLPAVARRLESMELMRRYFALVGHIAKQAPGTLPAFLAQVAFLLDQLPLGGLRRWVDTGIEGYRAQPEKLPDYFSLKTPDARAALLRERHGTLFVDHERRLSQYLRAFWEQEVKFKPYSLAFDTLRKPVPYHDSRGFHIPDVFDDRAGIRGVDRYRAVLAHMAAHRHWSKPIIADNFSPFQQLGIEFFEDCRIERLAATRYPGLRRLWLRLHPRPQEDACPEGWSCIRHKLAMLSRALLDPGHGYRDPMVHEFVQRFEERFADDPEEQKWAVDLGIAWISRFSVAEIRKPKVWFSDTEVDYRDDNRWLWMFLEDTEDEDEFTSDHAAANPKQDEEEDIRFTRHHPEWDYQANRYLPDWATVVESIHPAGDPAHIDALLERHAPIARRLKKLVDLLKPQQRVRVRYQEEGDELDLDVAVRAVIEHRSGTNPDPRIHQYHKHDGRDIAVMVLLDLSQSINDTPEGARHSVLQLSQEAVSLLGWAVEELGDRFAIAGFASNTRHEVHFLHVKGFAEPWGELPKGRLAAMKGALSTRMGAVLRHGANYLDRQPAEKKLMLLLTDGEPHDVDAPDAKYLVEDTRKAVEELGARGMPVYCVSLDPNADEYVSHIFGRRYTVIDRVERLPERLPRLFMSLTR